MRRTTFILALAVLALATTGTAFAAAGDSCNEAIVAQKGSTFGNVVAGASSWYTYEAGVDGRFPINTSMPGTQFDTRIAVFGACGGAPIAEGTSGVRRAYVHVDGFPGQRFYIEVAGMGGAGGAFELAINDPVLGPCNPTAGDGDCFVDTGTPQCEDTCGGPPCPGCCTTICIADAFCCDTAWDQICADAALAQGTPCIAIPVELKNFSVGD